MTTPAGRSRHVTVWLCGALAVVALLLSSCGDGQPEYCQDLAKGADMAALTKALDAQDLAAARTAASDFRELATSAPSDIRPDMEDLAGAVTDIVGLLSAERTAGPGADPAEVEQRREDLNQRLGGLSTTGSRVEDWASRNCGISLSGA
jgi:hypothetical protein